LYFAYYDDNGWGAPNGQSQQQFPSIVQSCVGPSLAALIDDSGIERLYAAWKGKTGDQGLYYTQYDGNGEWSEQGQPQLPIPYAQSSVGPSLAVFMGTLYAAWKGPTGDQGLYYAYYDGTEWSSEQEPPGPSYFPSPIGSSVGPSLAEFNGKLYAMWKGTNGDHRLWYASYDGAEWSKQATVPGNTGQEVMPC